MSSVDITPVIQAIIVLISTVITIFVIPWIKSKYTQAQLENVKAWVKIAVQAAEMLFPKEKQGELKKKYVIDFLAQKNMHFDEEVINNLIESAVLELNEQMKSK